MTNHIYAKYLNADIEKIIRHSEVFSSLAHPGEKGTFREKFLQELIEKYIPHPFLMSTGTITDHRGNQSKQIDIIIYDNHSIPPILKYEHGIFPIEVNYIDIEVKSTSTIERIRSSIESSKSISRLKYVYHEMHNPAHIPRKLFLYFAYTSDCSIDREFDRYKQIDPHYMTDPSLDLICIAGKGCYAWNKKYNTTGASISRWIFTPAESHNEIILFITFISNTLLTISRGYDFDYIRHTPFGQYIAETTNKMKSIYIEGLYTEVNGNTIFMTKQEEILKCGVDHFGEIPGDYPGDR